MASQTTNLNLIKPAYTDPADVASFNTNMDTIDAAYGTLNSNILPLLTANTVPSDLNNITTTGLTFTTGDTTNSPGAFSIVYTLVRDSSAAVQFALRTSIDAIYYRRKSGGTWNAWRTISFLS